MTAAPAGPHVGFVLPSLGGGGAERVSMTLAESLIDRGYRIDLVLSRLTGEYRSVIPRGLRLYYTAFWKTDRALLRHCRARGVSVHALALNPAAAAWARLALRRKRQGMRVGWKQAAFAWIIARYVRAARPRLLLSVTPYANIPAMHAVDLAGRSLPAIVSIHSNMSMGYARDWLPEMRELYVRADAVVAVSEGLACSVRQELGVEAERVHAIYNPIASDDIRRLARQEVDHPWFGRGEPPVIVSVGREDPSKDYATLVRAFVRLRREIRARLVIIGSLSESYRAGLISEAGRCGAQEDLGFVDFDENPFRYMSRASLLALSSRSEGLPTVLLEALACGTQVVSADTPHGGPREILGGGRWGRLVPVGDAHALAQAMIETLKGGGPSEAALIRRAACFSRERAADAYAALFEKVAGGAGMKA